MKETLPEPGWALHQLNGRNGAQRGYGRSIGIDLVCEFGVLVNFYTAEHGRAGSGVINMVSRSRTNSFHG